MGNRIYFLVPEISSTLQFCDDCLACNTTINTRIGPSLPFTDVHLSTGRVGGGGVLAEPPIGEWQAPIDM